MKKFFIPILIIIAIALVIVFFPKKSLQILTPVSVPPSENNEILKQELLISFKNFRESIYKIKQAEMIKSREKKFLPQIMKPEFCVKMAYDLQAFIMRARLAPKAIEKADCKKLNQYFWSIEQDAKAPKTSKPSYAKRLGKDVSYFAQELNKQSWPSEDLKKKKNHFDLETRINVGKLSKLTKSKKQPKASPAKCLETILMHEKEFRKVCKVQK